MNKLILTQTRGYNGIENYPNNIEESVATNVATLLYNLGKDDDNNHTLTYGVDTTNTNRPITSVKGSIGIPGIQSNILEYLQIKYPNLKINPSIIYISFEDSNVLGYLLAAGIGDGTGITTADVAQASLGTILKGKTDIVSFNELRYFTSWLTNPTNAAFYGCTNLTSVTLPNTITKFSYLMFYNCNNLSLDISLFNCVLSIGLSAFEKCYEVYGTINMPELQTIGKYGFSLCKKISAVECLGFVSSIIDEVFKGIQGSILTSVKIPYECLSIGSSAFEKLEELVTVKLYNKSLSNYSDNETPVFTDLSRVTSFKGSCFDYCKKLELTAGDLSGATYIGSNAFRLTKLSGNLVLNQSLTCTKSSNGSLGEGAFRETNITSILFPSGVTHLNNWLCYNCTISSRIMYLPYIISAGYVLFGGNTNISQFYLPSFTDLNTKLYFRNTSDNRGLFGNYDHVCRASLAYFKDLENLYPGIVFGTTVTTLVLNNSNITLLDGDATRDGNPLNLKHKVFACSAFSSWPNQGANPLWNVCGQGVNNKIFVPDNSVNDYKTNVFFVLSDDPDDTSNLIAGFDSSWIHGINEIDSTTGDYLLPRVNTRAEWDLIPDTDPNKNFTLILEYCGSNHGINPPLTTT